MARVTGCTNPLWRSLQALFSASDRTQIQARAVCAGGVDYRSEGYLNVARWVVSRAQSRSGRGARAAAVAGGLLWAWLRRRLLWAGLCLRLSVPRLWVRLWLLRVWLRLPLRLRLPSPSS